MNFIQQTARTWLPNERCTIIDYDSHVRTHLEKSLTSQPLFQKTNFVFIWYRVANFVNYSRWVKMRICSVQTVQRNMMCVCFLRETTFSEFDVDLILLLFIESYFILQCTFFVLEKSKKKTWWSMDQSMGRPMGELRFCIHPDV